MSDKAWCPVCNSETSDLWTALRDGEPCPYCGASASLIAEVNELRLRRADEQVKVELEQTLVKLDKVTRQRNELARVIREVRRIGVSPSTIRLLEEIANDPTP
jgi:DNA repair exonuclease SbcCD ATPase subunit